MSASFKHLLGLPMVFGVGSALKGWTNGVGCAGINDDVIIQFPEDVAFTDQVGISIYTSVDDGNTANKILTIDTPTKPKSYQVNYGSDWSTALIDGDKVYWDATGLNTYTVGGKALAATTVKLTNCLTYVPSGNEVEALPYLSTRVNYSLDLQQTLEAPMNMSVPEFNNTRF